MIIPAYAQTESSSVVINEVDLNPLGSDLMTALEWVELYNPTDEDIDLSDWQIASTTVLKKTMTIPDGTIIQPGKFLIFNYNSLWFTDSNDSVELKDGSGIVIDKTPTFSDTLNNHVSWQRLYDGYDSDSSDDWKFVTASPNSSNGIFIETPESIDTIVTVSSDKPSYVFGEVAIIEGHVSEKLFVTKPTFVPQQILITISGNFFEKSVALYPDLNLDFKITQNLNSVLGITGGDYLVSVKYGDLVSQTTFSVGDEIISEGAVQERTMSITTDESQYLPGSNVIFTAIPDFVVPLEGMFFEVHNPDGLTIFSGNLFLVDGKFSTSIFLNTVNPQYGTYKIIGQYSDQSVVTTFDLIEDIKEEKLISIWTDKEIYGPGDTVSISGRLNGYWLPSLNITIIQMQNLAIGDSGGFSNKILDVVNLNGDSSFDYSFKIPAQSGLGDYLITISKDIGSASKSFTVYDNPDKYDFTNDAFVAFSDTESYSFGDTLTINGKITNPIKIHEAATPVIITISDSSGNILDMTGRLHGEDSGASSNVNLQEKFTAIPDPSGRFYFKLDLIREQFDVGSYEINLKYNLLDTSVPFTLTDPNDTSKVILTLDKEVYGFGETVYLTGLLSTMTEPSIFITLTTPDGNTSNHNVTAYDQKFTWSWKSPDNVKYNAKSDGTRSDYSTNIGFYKISVGISDVTYNRIFKLSLDPANDYTSTSPLSLSAITLLGTSNGENFKIMGDIITSYHDVESIGDQQISLQLKNNEYPYNLIAESRVYPKSSGIFESYFKIPVTIFSDGTYKIKANYKQITDEYIFNLVDGIVSEINNIEKPQISKSSTVIEKENRITEKLISITTEEKSSDDAVISPRVISGSLVTPSRADESNVNLRVSTESGICIIGTDDECLVNESTRKPGQIYDVVKVDGLSLNVRYSGPDVRLEKFSILPESSSEFLPDTNWNVDVIKDDQISRFYYKVTYKTLE
jgi:hypothetical protein